jgi:hypothetical protein
MSYIRWLLEREEEIDPYDALGTIIIAGDEDQIEDRCTFLDAYFEALVLGIQNMEKGKKIEIDPLVEAEDIIFDYTGNNLIISYGKQQATIYNTNKFVEDIHKSVENFLKILDGVPVGANEERPDFEILRKFIQ